MGLLLLAFLSLFIFISLHIFPLRYKVVNNKMYFVILGKFVYFTFCFLHKAIYIASTTAGV